MKLAGKVLVKLAEMKDNGYIRWSNNLIVPTKIEDSDAIELYRIEKPLTEKEIAEIDKNPQMGIENAKEKFRPSGPVTISANNIYIDDTIIIQTKEGKTVLIGEIEE